MKLFDLLLFLDTIQRRPSRALSQNFLIDENIAKKILHLAKVAPNENILEIGPGPGALTSRLLTAGAKVFAVEKDEIFSRELNRFQNENLTSIYADFLKFNLSSLPSPIKVVANLPYHITTPILEILLPSQQFTSLTLMIQKEMADRIFATPGSKDFSSLSIFVQFYTTLDSAFKVPASCFYPKPTVDSKVIHLIPRKPPLENPAPFFALVRKAFGQRRKMLRTSLQSPTILYPNARPEDLSLDDWLKLYAALNGS